MARTTQDFQTIRSEGALLPPDLLRRVVDPKASLPGTKPEDYGLPVGERLNEVITQSWNRLRRHWAEFRAAAKNLPSTEAGTALTNDKWTLPLLRELGFGLLPSTAGPVIDGRSYPISRFYGPTAVHLIGCQLSLDRRAAGMRGAAAANPHGLVQEFLNRSDKHMWAILSNGLQLRLLRDNQALSRQSFLEFDLESMLSGEVYSDFVVLWLVAHASRFAPREGDRPDTCWLEQWTKEAQERGTRALGELRVGVEKSLQILGEGFTSHPKNAALRDALRSGTLSLSNFHGQLLRIVYRLIFLFVAEDRTLEGEPVLHPRDGSEAARIARERYAAHYSTRRLRELAGKIKGSRHGDLWRQFQLLVTALSGDASSAAIRQHLALPALGSFLWSPASTASLNDAQLTNYDLLEALRHLAFTRQGKTLRPVDYKNLGAEELGGVYECLLALTPQISADGARFYFAEFAGNERKTSGSYYTPDSLVQCLLDSALDPVVEEALKGKTGPEAEKAILDLKVCDPAVGSGHFLLGAARRMARHLARVRAATLGESEPSPQLYQHALRDVISRCLYGVDINPMSAELCRVSLWLEALEPGKPLSFLEHHIQVGNSLLGTTPALLAKGIPDDAFTPIEGDVKARVSDLKKQNKRERQDFINRQGYLFDPPIKLGNLAAELARIDEASNDTPEEIAEKERRYAEFVKGSGYRYGRLLADTWCAAFVWKKDDSDLGRLCPTERDFRRVESHAGADLLPHVRGEIERLRDQYQFFHWHLAFPDVFRLPGNDEQTGWSGGFDVVLGNPPWERVKLQEQEFFAQRDSAIAGAANAAARKKAIAALNETNRSLLAEFEAATRQAEGESHLMRSSGRYPLCGRGDINTYAVFAESMRDAIAPTGRLGVIVPTGIATDDTTKFFFGDLVESRTLVSYFGFKNERFLFPRPVEHTVTFGLLTVVGRALSSDAMSFCWLAWTVEEMNDPSRRIVLTAEDIDRLNPNTRTCPVFRCERDAEITKAIYRRVPVLIREAQDNQPEVNPWGLTFLRMFDMANASGLFIAPEVACPAIRDALALDLAARAPFLPLYEAKMLHQFDHRWATYARDGCDWLDTPILTKINKEGKPEPDTRDLSAAEKNRPETFAAPRYWVSAAEVEDRLIKTDKDGNVTWRWDREWLIGFRRVCRSTDERSAIFAVLPRVASGDSVFCAFPDVADARKATAFYALTCSFVFDYVTRQKAGGVNMSFFVVNQLPVLPPSAFAAACPWDASMMLANWIGPRVLELVYTAHDLAGFARDHGHNGSPFRWDVARRAQIRAELDAAFFHLYGVSRDDAAYIMDTFLVFKARDEERNGGVYKTKDTILEIYDAMQEAIRTGKPYQTRLDPPPADPRCCHPPRPVASQPQGRP